MQRACRMRGLTVAVVGNNLTPTRDLNNLLRVIQVRQENVEDISDKMGKRIKGVVQVFGPSSI